MDDYVKGMLDEFRELDGRIMEFGAFLNGETFRTLDIDEQSDMYDLWHAMVLYKSALGRRLVRRGYDGVFYKGTGA